MYKILVVGIKSHKMHATPLNNAFLSLGHNSQLLALDQFLIPNNEESLLSSLNKKLTNKFCIGFNCILVNTEVIDKCNSIKPDIVFIYNQRCIFPSTIKKIKKMGCKVFLYSNDNPFSSRYPFYFWRFFKQAIKYVDILYVYRKKNLFDSAFFKPKCVRLLRSFYVESRNFPNIDPKANIPDVVFLGHYENDDRVEYIAALTNEGIKVGISGFHKAYLARCNLKNLIILHENNGCHYNYNLSNAKIALVFLSKTNHDEYTRRCFEIPATQVMMMSVYSEELSQLFKENKEIVFFKTTKELIEKTRYYLLNNHERLDIAYNGYKRVISDHHEVKDRAMQIIKDYEEIQGSSMNCID